MGAEAITPSNLFIDSPMSKAFDAAAPAKGPAPEEPEHSNHLSDLSDTEAVPTPMLGAEERSSARPPTGMRTPSDKSSGFGNVPPPSRVNIPLSFSRGDLGLSPSSAFLDSPLLLPPNLAEPSPTTGTYPLPHLFRTTSSESNAAQESGQGGFHPPAGGYTLKPFAKSLRPSVTATARMSPLGQPAKTSVGTKAPEDGYCWRKYGQKHVKGHPYPRSYFKCTTSNCPAKKKVERNENGVITSCIYKCLHTHQPPNPSKLRPEAQNPTEDDDESPAKPLRPGQDDDSSSGPSQSADDSNDSEGVETGHPEIASRPAGRLSARVHARDCAAAAAADDDEEAGPKRRRVSAAATSKLARAPTSVVVEQTPVEGDGLGARRDTKEPRLVVQTTSDVDVLDDGYRWRKYGQKLVKGNPYPRSYYKCTSAGCGVRKHVERSSADPKSVVTTYEGVHNHQPPAAAPARGDAARVRAAAAAAAAARANAAAAAEAGRQGGDATWVGGRGEVAAPARPHRAHRAASRNLREGGAARMALVSDDEDEEEEEEEEEDELAGLDEGPRGLVVPSLPSPSYVLPSPTPLDDMTARLLRANRESSSAAKPSPLLMDPDSLLPSHGGLGAFTPKSTPACDPALFLTTPTTPTPRSCEAIGIL